MFRALYSEKRVVAEERRARIDNAPLGRFQEAFAGAALANNYSRPVIGYAQDVEALVRDRVEGCRGFSVCGWRPWCRMVWKMQCSFVFMQEGA